MKRLHGVLILGGIWAAFYVASVLVLFHTGSAGDGFTRGLNRLTLFFQYQIIAGVIAVVIWRMGRKLTLRWQRWFARMPALLALTLFLLSAGVIVSANMTKGGPTEYVPDPDRPVTAPAEPLPDGDGNG